MSQPLPPLDPDAPQPIVLEAVVRRTQNPTVAGVILITAVFLVMASVLAIFQLNSQNSLSSLQTKQDQSQVARDQLAQVICTIWRTAPAASRIGRPAAQVAELDRLCNTLLPVAPSPSPSKG